jgi:DNA polymerase-1
MDILSETYLKYSPQSIEALIGKKRENQKSMQMLRKNATCNKEIFTLELDKTEPRNF